MPTVNRVEGLEETLENLRGLPQKIGRTALRKSLLKAAQPVVVVARSLAPVDEANLVRSIIASPNLTRRQRRIGGRQNEVEIYIGPARGADAGMSRYALNYASFVEFGTVDTPAQPYLRPAWDRMQGIVLKMFADDLKQQVEAAAGRVSRKFFKLR